ncbi:MAG: glycosyltransferase family 2 protein [Polyangia bacterium]
MCYTVGVLKRLADRARRLGRLPGRLNHSFDTAERAVPEVQEAIEALRVKLADAHARIDALQPLVGLERELDAVRSRHDLGDALVDEFQRARQTAEYRAPYAKATPLVTLCIGTYNRAGLLIERSLRSALAQDWPALEVIVVGDACTDDTAARVAAVGDERVRFVNLPVRGAYPTEPHWRWMVAGTTPFNHALELAQGDFITHLDDDDEHPPERVRKLVGALQTSGADLVWHPFHVEQLDGSWTLNSAADFRKNQVTTSAVLYHRWFRRVPWDLDAWRYLEPGDWNRFRKLRWLGAHTVRFDEPLLRHYKERNQRAH